MCDFSKDELKKIIDYAPAVTYVIKAYDDFAPKFVSSNIVEQSGYTVQECFDTPNFWSRCLHPDDRDAAFHGFKNIFTTGKHKHEYRFRTKDGRYIWVLDELQLVTDAQGQPHEIIGSWLDITRQKELESELLVKQEKLRKIDQMKSHFISIAAHELNTPLSSILGYVELLSNQGMCASFTEEQKQEFMEEIILNCESLSKLIDELLNVSRIESGKSIPLKISAVALEPFLRKVIKRFQLSSTQPFDVVIAPGCPETAEFDAHRISQVLDNIISNAIKYSPAESTVTINLEAARDRLFFAVVDRGIGMTDSEVDQIFDKFYRADHSDTASRGLGIGMSIAKQIVAEHRGEISVESSPDAGTKVAFSLPIR